MINKNIPIPIYYQLMQEIKDSIENGELKPGDPIPTEFEIMTAHGISRATVRQAILQLVNEGYLRRIKAKGTFVKSPQEKPRFLGSLKGFSQEMQQDGILHYTKVLDNRIISAPLKISEKLHLENEAPIFYLKRLRFVKEEPVLIAESHLPAKLFTGIEDKNFEDVSLYETMEKNYGIVLHHGRREFMPVMPSSTEDVELLKISSKVPILYVESIVFTEDNIPVEYGVIKMKGKFIVELVQNK